MNELLPMVQKKVNLLKKEWINILMNEWINLPIVEIKVALKASSENLNRTQVFPTPESPMSNNLNR